MYRAAFPLCFTTALPTPPTLLSSFPLSLCFLLSPSISRILLDRHIIATGVGLLRISGFFGGYGLIDIRSHALSTFGCRFWQHAGSVVGCGGGESGEWEETTYVARECHIK